MSEEKDFYYSDVNEQKEAIAHLLECTQWWPSTREHKVLKGLLAERERLRAELAAMREQRDEARELYCVEAAQHSVCRRSVMDAWTIARYRGWEGLFAEGGGA